QGSSVTHTWAPAVSAPAARTAARATASAWGPPTGSVAPSKRRPSAVSSTQPTQGLGGVDARTAAARRLASAIRSWSVLLMSVLTVIVLGRLERGRARRRRPRPAPCWPLAPSSLPSGLSPSAPGSHRIGRPTGCEEVRGLHRRSGLPPNPARDIQLYSDPTGL